MKDVDFIEINKNGWNKLLELNKPFSNVSLPEYGPFLKRNEEQILLFNKIENAKVLDLGCGSGGSLDYLLKKGASEIWGVDISEKQIDRVKERFPNFKNNFFVAPMENEIKIPNDYFDYIISIFSIGYTSNLFNTLKCVYKYLNKQGSIIISWTHPFYYCLDIEKNKVVINKSYFNEESEIITKGTDKIKLVQNNLMISTIINTARDAGFYVDTILEEETVLKDDVNGYKSSFWRKEKTINCPSTLILKFKKMNWIIKCFN